MRCARTIRGMVVAVVLVFTHVSSAAIVQDIAGTLLSTDWYHGNGDYFQTNYAGSDWPAYIDNLCFSTEDGAYYWIDNSLTGGTFSIESSSLVQDQSSGGLAKGKFASGATLTINGDLYADDWETIVASGDLVIAQVTAQWELKELPAPPARADTVVGRAFFHITGGVLSNPSNDVGLVLGDFYIDFTFQGCSPTVRDFSTLLGDNAYNCPHSSIQGALGVPEPASIAILGLGGLALIRRRK